MHLPYEVVSCIIAPEFLSVKNFCAPLKHGEFCFAFLIYIGQGHFQGMEVDFVFEMWTFVRYEEILAVIADFFGIFSALAT